MTKSHQPPEVPEDAPPAILFRLSYRTNEEYRSGFRESDSPQQIVQSMRGWWELDPREVRRLGVEHAVAFHRGKTRAVVKISCWKWLEVEGDGHHREPVDGQGHDFATCTWPQAPGIRWGFDTPREQVPDEVSDAWLGERGKRVPDRLYHTITSYWPASPVDSPHDLLGKALQLLGEGLRPFMEAEFEPRRGSGWREQLRTEHGILKHYRGKLSSADPFASLLILLRELSNLKGGLGPRFEGTIQKLTWDRNRWAHFAGVSTKDAIDGAARVHKVLDAIGAEPERRRVDSIGRALDLQINPPSAASRSGTPSPTRWRP
ncbi:Swt1 family HEPN domain-containing protein [Candidatus Poriferisodalis sp.]|uniref:Swt1 family HEPN domain-containing protein n=1 Tax=Candidatus Poriferisodalis sp. TaxID=3101277 RepID=UPI003B5AEB62